MFPDNQLAGFIARKGGVICNPDPTDYWKVPLPKAQIYRSVVFVGGVWIPANLFVYK
jgi:hypothetical protein